MKKLFFLLKINSEPEAWMQIISDFIFVPGAINARYEKEMDFREFIEKNW